MGFAKGQEIEIGDEIVTVEEVIVPRGWWQPRKPHDNKIVIASALKKAHKAGDLVAGTGIMLEAPLASSHQTGAAMLYQSLGGHVLIGCGAGSGCDSVMGSRWGYILESVPVSLPALASYLILMCPVPLSADCNPYIPDGIDRFKGSCAITRRALAKWLCDRDGYPDFESRLMSGEDTAGEAIPAEMLKDPRIDDYLERVYELFGRTSSKEKSGIPRFIYKDRWVVPETDSVEGLVQVLGELVD